MNRKFSPKVKKIISFSRNEALRLGHDYIGTEHLLLGMLFDNDNLAVRVLDAMDVDFTELKTGLKIPLSLPAMSHSTGRRKGSSRSLSSKPKTSIATKSARSI